MTTQLDKKFGENWVKLLVKTLNDLTDDLGDLDRRAGDGDFGTNLATAMKLAQKNIKENQPSDYRQWVTAVSTAFLGVGGTSGPLFGMFFRDLAKISEDKQPSIEEFAAGVVQSLKTNQYYGGAKVGEKTMVDALVPAAKAAQKESANSAVILAHIADAAREGAQSTREITATKGRASYVGDAAKGVLDPGAATVAVAFACAAAAADSTYKVKTSWIK